MNLSGVHHDHIDGSIAVLDVIHDLYQLAQKPFPFASIDAWRAYMRDPDIDIVERFSTVASVTQTAEALTKLGYAYGKRRSEEGLRYVEAKFAPSLHTREGLTLRKASDAMITGLRKAGREFGITILPVLCINREADADTGIAIAKVALEYDGEVAMDLVNNEAESPPERHAAAYKLTYGSKVKRDCHAGEWVAKEPVKTYEARLVRNIKTALFELKCDGVSQAIPLAKYPELVAYVADRGIRVSGCPLSNLESGLIHDVQELGINTLLDRGVIYTLNADDDLLFSPMKSVIETCDATYNFTPEQQRKLEENVVRGAFRTFTP